MPWIRDRGASELAVGGETVRADIVVDDSDKSCLVLVDSEQYRREIRRAVGLASAIGKEKVFSARQAIFVKVVFYAILNKRVGGQIANLSRVVGEPVGAQANKGLIDQQGERVLVASPAHLPVAVSVVIGDEVFADHVRHRAVFAEVLIGNDASSCQ